MRDFSIRKKLICAFSGVVVLCLLLLGYINDRAMRKSLTDVANEFLLTAASQTAAEIDHFISANLDAINTEARLPSLGTYLRNYVDNGRDQLRDERMSGVLKTFRQKDEVFIYSYALLDIHGCNIIDTRAADIGQDESNRSYFKTPLSIAFGRRPYVSQVEFEENGHVSLYFSNRVVDSQKKVVGVLRARYSASILQHLLFQNAGLAGHKSFPILLDENHVRLAYGSRDGTDVRQVLYKSIVPFDAVKISDLQSKRRLPKKPPNEISTDMPTFEQGLDKGIKGLKPFFATVLGTTGNQPMACVVTKLEIQPWLIVFAKPQKILLAPIKNQTRNTLFAGVIIAMLAISVAVIVAYLLARPISHLTALTRKAAEGDLAAEVHITTRDEIGTLASTFSTMTSQLRELIGSLEQEIVERKRAEANLQESEERYRSIFENAVEGNFQSTPGTKGRFINANPAHAHILGYDSPEQMITEVKEIGPRFWIDPQKRQVFSEQVAKGVVSDFEVQMRRRDGRLIWVSLNARPVFNALGKLDYIEGTMLDITGRKQAEQALRESEDRYRGLFENSPISIWEEDFSQSKEYFDGLRKSGITDFRSYFENNAEAVAHCAKLVKVTDINKATLELLRSANKDGLLAGLPKIFTEDSFAVFREELITLAEGGLRFESEAVQRTLTGEEKHVALQLIVAPGYENSLGKVLVSLLDITERKRTEGELKKYQEQLEELVKDRTIELAVAKDQAEAANSAKSDFLARMSHEIRTPLNAVIGLTNVVLKSELKAEQREYLRKVQIASNNLLVVINDILDFSKVEAGRLELTHAPFDLDQVMERLSDLFSNRVAQKDIELVFVTTPQVPRQLMGDAVRLTQVLTNLIENAVKFTDKGEIVVGVEPGDGVVQADQQTGKAIMKFRVSDTGCGISADVLSTLFEPFTQADRYLTRKHEGTGLGLAICRRLVELMSGTIEAQSTPGQGSTFSFTVSLDTFKEFRPSYSLPEYLHGLKALVVDDSATARQVMCDLLESFTCNVTAVDSGEKAIEAVRRDAADEPYQLVLLDWKMPGLDGMETAKRIRELEPQLPETTNQKQQSPIIILVTAYGRKLVIEGIDTETVNTLLLKPIKPSQLCNTIVELLGQTEDAAACRVREPGVQPAHRLSGRRVLVVEDSELNRDVAVALLKETGLAVEIAENGQVAVDKVTKSPKEYYDALLMDIQMPVMDGYEATRKIREREADAQTSDHRIPIIALTAHALKGEEEKCLAADMDDYLPKPLDERDFHRVLVKWITPKPEEANTAIRPQSRGTSDDQGVLDVQEALKRLGGRRQLYGKVLRKFESESAKAHAIITRHIATSDMEAASRMAHTVKGTAIAIGAVKLSQVAAELETAIRDNSSDVGDLLSVFKSKLEKTLQSVNELLETDSEGLGPTLPASEV
jgi:PAS domain S-box-containing protein